MSLQLEWKYLQRNVPGVDTLMVPIEEALIDTFFYVIFWGGMLTFGKY